MAKSKMINTTATVLAPEGATLSLAKGKNKAKSEPAFSITVHTVNEEFKTAGQVLVETRHIVAYVLGFTTDDEAIDKRLEAVATTDKGKQQIVDMLKTVNLEGIDATDEMTAFLEALKSSPFVLADMSAGLSAKEQIQLSAPEHSFAVKYGAMLSTATMNQLEASYQGLLEHDAGPIMTMKNLQVDLADMKEGNVAFIDAMPVMNTRYQKGKNDRVPHGFKLPTNTDKDDKRPVADPLNGFRFDHYLDANGAKGDVVREFYLAQKEGAEKLARLDFARNLAKATPVMDVNTPPDIKNLFSLPGGQQTMIEMVASLQREINDKVRVMRQAFTCWQRIEEWSSHFNGRIIARLVGESKGESMESIARKRKPIQLCLVTKGKDAKTGEATSETEGFAIIPLGSFIKMEPKAWPVNVSPAKIMEKKVRVPKVPGEANKPGGASEANKNNITNAATFQEAVVNAGLWVGSGEDVAASKSRYSAIVTAATKDASFASALVRMETVIDGALTADIRKIAAQFDSEQAAATAKLNKTDDKAA